VASYDEHSQQARDNYRVAQELLALQQGTSEDRALLQWAVTTLFYTSVHCLEAHFATRNLHTHSHASRDRLLARLVPAHVHVAHRQLQGFSELCRYEVASYDHSFVEQTVLQRYLLRVARYTGITL